MAYLLILCGCVFNASAIERPAKDTLPGTDTTQIVADSVPYAQDSVIFDVSELLCELCAVHLHNELSNVKGVIKNEVSYEDKTAFVKFNPNATSLMKIIRVIEDAGYGASIRPPDH